MNSVHRILAYLSAEENLLGSIVWMLLSILLLGIFLRRFNQPYFVAYIMAGILLGPHGFKIFTDVTTIAQIGSLGLIIQMFFIGAELEVPALLGNGRTLVVGTLVQLLLSALVVAIIGSQMEWSTEKILLFTFILSLSSSAIILEYLHKNNEMYTRLGIITTGILILQDVLFVPMIMTLNAMGNHSFRWANVVAGIMVITLFILFLRLIVLKKKLVIPSPLAWKADPELQVFIGLLVCFGFAWLTSTFQLSAALGAMFAGMLISQSESTKWLDQHLVPFRIFFISFFFLSIGLQIDTSFLIDHWMLIMMLVLSILIINSGINALVFRLLKETWPNSIYAGALLSQIGELSLVLATVARVQSVVDEFSYQLALAVISLTMLLTSVWIGTIRKLVVRA